MLRSPFKEGVSKVERRDQLSRLCDCGEQVEDGQTFCRRCGKRAVRTPEAGDRTRKLTQSRVRGSAPSPPPHHAQPTPLPPPPGRGGPKLQVIVAGVVAVLVLAGGIFAFATLGSNGDSGTGSSEVLDVYPKDDVEPSGDPNRRETVPSDESIDKRSRRGNFDRSRRDDRSPSIPPYREDCGNEVFAAGSASCPFSRNIAAQYRDAPGSMLYDVYSPETKIAYDVECRSDAELVTCEGGVNATVYFYP